MPGKVPRPTSFAAILFVILFSVADLSAQPGNATIAGAVTNATGAPVANAKITAKSLTTGETIATQSDATGHFHFDALPPADYEISISAVGFESRTSRLPALRKQ
jgi:hypothetical protein